MSNNRRTYRSPSVRNPLNATWHSIPVCFHKTICLQSTKRLSINVFEQKTKNVVVTDLTRIMAKSKDINELTHMWQQWHDETGRPLRSKFIRYVELSNEAARLNGNPNTNSIWPAAWCIISPASALSYYFAGKKRKKKTSVCIRDWHICTGVMREARCRSPCQLIATLFRYPVPWCTTSRDCLLTR